MNSIGVGKASAVGTGLQKMKPAPAQTVGKQLSRPKSNATVISGTYLWKALGLLLAFIFAMHSPRVLWIYILLCCCCRFLLHSSKCDLVDKENIFFCWIQLIHFVAGPFSAELIVLLISHVCHFEMIK
jgi:hypothetical protein